MRRDSIRRSDRELSTPCILAISTAFALFASTLYLLVLAGADKIDMVRLEPPASTPASTMVR